MRKKFECLNCGKHFDADDSNMVTCPYCQSDNVDIANFKIPSIVWKAGAAIAALAIAALIVLNICKKEEKEANNTEFEISELDANSSDSTSTIAGLDIPPTIELSNLVFEGKGYAFKVSVKNAPNQKAYIAILHPFDNSKVIAKSNNGSFNDIPYSDVDGAIYSIALMDATTDTIICSIDKPGFIKQATVEAKMTVAELQQKIDSRDESLMGVGENDYLSPNYKLKFVGLPSDAVNIPSNLYEVFEKLDMETWTQARVKDLSYDDKNRISVITISVKLPDDNF